MGTKFANIHIKSESKEDIKEALVQWKNGDKQNRVSMIQGIDIPVELKEMMFGQQDKYYIGRFNEKWYSILNEDFCWESINDVSLDISRNIVEPIISLGYYDDDLLLISIIEQGNVLTEHISGYSLDVYGLEEKLGDVSTFINVLCLNISEIELKSIFSMEDIEEKVMKLEKVFRLPLWIKADWIDEMDEGDEDRRKWDEITLN